MDTLDLLNDIVDKSQVPPINPKRLLAFVNHFLISSCTFLNKFAEQCEEKFIKIERKMQKIEASLIIIEAKVASIPDVETTAETDSKKNLVDDVSETLGTTVTTVLDDSKSDAVKPIEDSAPTVKSHKACEDERYQKFFKMVQFGVPPNAVKMKMQVEGFDASILDTPDIMIEDDSS